MKTYIQTFRESEKQKIRQYDVTLAKWLRARLAKCLPIDNWHREQLEHLASKLARGEA